MAGHRGCCSHRRLRRTPLMPPSGSATGSPPDTVSRRRCTPSPVEREGASGASGSAEGDLEDPLQVADDLAGAGLVDHGHAEGAGGLQVHGEVVDEHAGLAGHAEALGRQAVDGGIWLAGAGEHPAEVEQEPSMLAVVVAARHARTVLGPWSMVTLLPSS